MTSLTDFLLARIAEDEAIARNAPGPNWYVAVERTGEPGRWRGIGAYLLTLSPANRHDSLSVGEEIGRSWGSRPFVVDHIARWDPARVLAECDAKRRIVEKFSEAKRWNAAEWDSDYDDDGRQYSGAIAETWESALRLLALPYADRPGYREEWRP